MFYLGFSGKIGTGKSTLTQYLITLLDRHDNMNVLKTSFGSILRKEVSTCYDIPYYVCASQEAKAKEFHVSHLPDYLRSPEWGQTATLRQILQFYGTDVTRKNDPDYWVKALDNAVNEADKNSTKGIDIVIVDDIRFPNEKQLIESNGICMRIQPYEGWQPGSFANHISETALDDAKFLIKLKPKYGKLEQTAEEVYSLIFDILHLNY